MKGTLFSADFIEDVNGNLRLLELNTDTAVTTGGLNHIDFTGFIDMLSSSSINEVHVISKNWHLGIVNKLSQSLAEAAPFITSFQNTLEQDSSIYPTDIEDSTSKFILRMAYDESAIFDSEYAKNKKNVLELFYNAGDTLSIAEYYVSSSVNGVTDILPTEFNSSNIPDVITKNLSNVNSPLSFYKIGKSSLSASDRYTELKSFFDEDTLILKYYENTTDVKVKSIRSLNIIYGSNLDVLNLGTFIAEGLFDKPAEIEFDNSLIATQTNIKHYYELSTSYPKFNTYESWGGIFEEEEIVKTDGSTVLISNAVVGDEFKSYYIEGAPDTDIISEFMSWSHPGSQLPSGSHLTSSILVNNLEQPLVYGLVYHFVLEDSSDFRAAAGSHMLIYDTVEDCIKYEDIQKITNGNHKFIDLNGGLVNIQSISIEVLDGTYSAHTVDMEQSDAFFLSNGNLSVKIVTHNCFPAGTEITLANGDVKNIEDLTTNDTLLTWNEKTGELVEGSIGNIVKKVDNLLIHLITSEGEIKSTPFHRFYVKGKKWISAQDIVIGDTLLNEEGKDIRVTNKCELLGEVEVFHILDVRDNHTYFANNILVHNFKIQQSCFIAGTKILMEDYSYKNIEEISIGEKIISLNIKTKNLEVKKVIGVKTPIHDDIVTYKFSNGAEISCTFDHPFYVNEYQIASYLPSKTQFLNEIGVYNIGNEIYQINVGDNGIDVNGNKVEILSIKEVEAPTPTQTYIITVEDNHNFYANGVLVHNK
jgi:hypothetical protein